MTLNSRSSSLFSSSLFIYLFIFPLLSSFERGEDSYPMANLDTGLTSENPESRANINFRKLLFVDWICHSLTQSSFYLFYFCLFNFIELAEKQNTFKFLASFSRRFENPRIGSSVYNLPFCKYCRVTATKATPKNGHSMDPLCHYDTSLSFFKKRFITFFFQAPHIGGRFVITHGT